MNEPFYFIHISEEAIQNEPSQCPCIHFQENVCKLPVVKTGLYGSFKDVLMRLERANQRQVPKL